MRAVGSGGDCDQLESVCVLCEQLLFHPSLQSVVLQEYGCSIVRFSHVARGAVNLHFDAKSPKFYIVSPCGLNRACLCILCSAKGNHQMTSVMPSDAFPAGPLCVLPALPPILPECWSSLLSPAECPVFLPLYLCPY